MTPDLVYQRRLSTWRNSRLRRVGIMASAGNY